MQAHVEGRIDLSKARLHDRHWLKALRWTLNHVERQNRIDYYKMQHARHCGVLTYALGPKVFDVHWEQGLALEGYVRADLFPWDKASDKKSVYKSMVEQWERIHGKLDDPATQKKIRNTVRHLQTQASAGGRKPFGVAP